MSPRRPRTSRFLLPLAVLVFCLPGCTGTGGTGDWLKAGSAMLGGSDPGGGRIDIAAGLREALRVGTETVVQQVGVRDGFDRDRNIRIPLPKRLNTMRGWLGAIGMGGAFNDLETRLNRAAEAAAPQAKQLFWGAIRQMTLRDARAIFDGPQDAATQYFRSKMTPQLRSAMRPIIADSLSRVGAIQRYDEIVSRYQSTPGTPRLAPDLKAQLADHTLDGALAGIFHYLAREEAAIRQNPAKRTTELLRSVFGSRSQ